MQAIQDRLFAGMTCFGCGPANARGLQLKSFERDGEVVAEFAPWPEHDNGGGFLNGGIIATLLDCHSAAAVHVLADQCGYEPAPGSALTYVTAGIDVRYRRPAPLTAPVRLTAEVLRADETEMLCRAEVWHEDKVRATGEALWRRWQPRP